MPHTYRPDQQGMGYSAALALRDNMVLLSNAGVGIGKTFAYLLPALTWLHRRPFDTIVVATRTILLQHQLMEDINTAQRILNTQIPVLLVKGQQQYLCMDRLQNTSASLTSELRRWRRLWADRLADQNAGLPLLKVDQIDRSAFSRVPDTLWSAIQVTPQQNCNTCQMRRVCGWYGLREKRIQFRGLLVVNHGLLARDAYNRNSENRPGLWPRPKAVIIDEAHAFEDALREASALPVRDTDVRRIFSYVSRRIASSSLSQSQAVAEQLDSMVPRVVSELRKSIHKSNVEAARMVNKYEIKAQVFSPTANLVQLLDEFLNMQDMVENAYALTQPNREQDGITLSTLFRSLRLLHRWVMERDQSPYVVWIDDKRVIQVGVLDLSGPTQVITQQSAIFTSGTLGIKDDFTLLEVGLGLRSIPSERILRLYAPSPFDYPHQLKYHLATNLPDPRHDRNNFHYRVDEIARALLSIHQDNARILALFTSKRFLTAIVGALQKKASIIYDGQGSADELARQFRESSRLIYLSTAAWEGLDAPGHKAIVIVQLPYPVPNDPWLKAKSRNARFVPSEEMDRIIIPVMQIRMTQGTGRAIRRHDDSSTAFMLDPRAPERFQEYLAPILPDAPASLITL